MTIADLSKLSDEELNVRLAEFCGWTFIERLAYTGIPKGSRGNADARVIPQYTTDLNAVAAVEAGLTAEQHYQFRCTLWNVTDPNGQVCSFGEMAHNRAYVSASARQRTIAIIATLTP